MKDPHDRQTVEFIPKEKTMKFRANYGYSVKGKLRSGALILDAKDLKEAKVEANKQLSAEYDWYQLNSVIALTMPKASE